MSEPWVLLAGIPSEPPLQMAAEALDRRRTPYLLLNQREFAATRCDLEVGPEGIGGLLIAGGRDYPISQFCSIYTRLSDYQILPEYGRGDESAQAHCESLHRTLMEWFELAPGRVVNRSRPSSSNQSKPYQAQLIRQHFPIPDTLLTNDPAAVAAFVAEHPRVIYKSTSGFRSIVREFSEADLNRLDDLRWCPVQFQQKVEGLDVRVHVIGKRAFATAIESEGADYRYAHRENLGEARLRPLPLDDSLEARSVALAASLGLEFAGIDLRLTPEGEAYCFEVNPSPAYSYYEAHTGQPIAAALACHLAWGDLVEPGGR